MPVTWSNVYTTLTSSQFLCVYLVLSSATLRHFYLQLWPEFQLLSEGTYQGHADIPTHSTTVVVSFLASVVSTAFFFAESVDRLIKVGFFKSAGECIVTVVGPLFWFSCYVILVLLGSKPEAAEKAEMAAPEDNMKGAQDTVSVADEPTRSAAISQAEFPLEAADIAEKLPDKIGRYRALSELGDRAKSAVEKLKLEYYEEVGV